MGKAANMDDLFGHVPQRRVAIASSGANSGASSAASPDDEPGDAADHEWKIDWEDIPRSSGAPPVHTPDTIRAIMHGLLAKARAATVLPWRERALRYHTGMFPYYAEWLKGGEGDRLMAEFKAEMDRLNAPVELVAPNWREIWGLSDC